MHKLRDIATQSTRRGGNICYTCFKQLIRREYSDSKAQSHGKTLSQSLFRSIAKGNEWAFEKAPEPEPFSLVTRNSLPGQAPQRRQRSNGSDTKRHTDTHFTIGRQETSPSSYTKHFDRREKSHTLENGFDTRIHKVSSHLSDKQETLQSSHTKYLDHKEKLQILKNGARAAERATTVASSPAGKHNSKGLIRYKKVGGSELEEKVLEPRIRPYYTTATKDLIPRLPGMSTNLNRTSAVDAKRNPRVPTGQLGSTIRLYSTSARVQKPVTAIGDALSTNGFYPLALNTTTRDKLLKFQQDLDNAKAAEKAALELALPRSTFASDFDVLETEVEEEDQDDPDQQDLDSGDTIADVRPLLEVGDLIELSSISNPLLAVVTAVFLHGGFRQVQIVTSNSSWIHKVFTASRQPTFVVKGLFKESELASVRSHLPKSYLQLTINDDQGRGILPVEISRSVTEKIQMFQKGAAKVYQQHAIKIDDAFKNLARDKEPKTMPLEHITHQVLHIHKSQSVSEETLYAIHRACTIYNPGFLFGQYYWHTRQLELLSKEEAKIIEQVGIWTREHSEYMVSHMSEEESSSKKSVLAAFADEIRPIVLESRKNREPLASGGYLGPSKLQLDEVRNEDTTCSEVVGSPVSETGVLIFKFLEIFTDRKFSIQGSARIQILASAILRSTGLYDEDIMVPYSRSLNLLKECGVMPPWQPPLYVSGRWSDIHQHDHPKGSQLLARAQKEVETIALNVDDMKELRHDWGDMPVFCIDSASTIEVDDGISLEKTSELGVYWIHVHIANPTAFISPTSKIHQLAQFLQTSVYLPDRFYRMLPFDVIREKLSLQPGCPTLTISTKVNMEGAVLDRQVRNGFINNVLRITPETLSTYIHGASPSKTLRSRYVVGHFPIPHVQNDYVTSTLSAETVEQLRTLKQLGEAWDMYRAKAHNHEWSFNTRIRPSVNVYHQRNKDVDVTHFRQFYGDPTISLSISSSLWEPCSEYPIIPRKHKGLVENIMQLANNTAAEWCAQRGIPAVFRGISLGKRSNFNAEAAHSLHPSGDVATDFQQYCRRVSNLIIDVKKEVSAHKIAHEAIGVDAYLRATSPLRRYEDLINHWQIEAALREEAKLGRPVVEHDFPDLPFSKAMLRKEFTQALSTASTLSIRNSHIVGHWETEFLTRAILFDECTELPKVFTFYVITAGEMAVHGMIAELNEQAHVNTTKLAGIGVLPDAGQIWKVKLGKDTLHRVGRSWQLVERIA